MSKQIVILRVSGSTREENRKAGIKFLESVRRGIIADQNKKGLVSSGESARSLVIVDADRKSELQGSSYFQQQITGRRPGKFPPIQPIMDWIESKGLDLEGITKKSLAFIIARKIARKGTDIYQGKRDGIDLKGIVKKYQPTYKEDLVKAGKIEIKTAIRKALSKGQTGNIRITKA